eukprot:15855953-Heterocapsa_arctica.AAC.2
MDQSMAFRSWLLDDVSEALLYCDHVRLQEVRDEHIQKVLQIPGRAGAVQQALYGRLRPPGRTGVHRHPRGLQEHLGVLRSPLQRLRRRRRGALFVRWELEVGFDANAAWPGRRSSASLAAEFANAAWPGRRSSASSSMFYGGLQWSSRDSPDDFQWAFC